MKKLTALALAALLFALLLPFSILADSAYSMASTSLAGASPEKLHNIRKAAAKLNGLSLPRGQVFSFNDLVGPRNKASGYKMEENGHGKRVFGGGVAQIATTLDMALAGFDGHINHLERHTWGDSFTDNYAPSGDQAVRVSYSEGYNYAFTDNFQSIQLDVWVENDQLFCLVKGKGDDPGSPEAVIPPDSGQDIVFASIQSYDVDSHVISADCFEMLKGQEAVNYLVSMGYYSVAEAQGIVDNQTPEQFVPKPLPDNKREWNINGVNFMLLYQPSGEPAPGGVPSSAGDFRALYMNNSALLTGDFYYRVHLNGGLPVYIEQFPWP